MLENSIENNWKGVFVPKGIENGKDRKSENTKVIEQWAGKQGVDIYEKDEPGIDDLGGGLPLLEANGKET